VVPVRGSDGRPIGVLDVDSHRPDHFDVIDRGGYESVVRMLEQRWCGRTND
jgi:putative methionine-R-sulfoxide reductase with GAF domain